MALREQDSWNEHLDLCCSTVVLITSTAAEVAEVWGGQCNGVYRRSIIVAVMCTKKK